MKTFVLNNGMKIPAVGFGTYKLTSGEETISAVSAALEAGYRHIDTAEVYCNEESVGYAVSKSGIPRENIFLTTKIWNNCHDFAKAAFKRTLQRLNISYMGLKLHKTLICATS